MGFAGPNDRLDVRVLADAVWTDPNLLRRRDQANTEIMQLRDWSRMAEELTAQRTCLTHQV